MDLSSVAKANALAKWESTLSTWRDQSSLQQGPESLQKPRIRQVNRQPSTHSASTSVGPSASVACALAEYRCTRCFTLPTEQSARFCYRCGTTLHFLPKSTVSAYSTPSRAGRGDRRAARRVFSVQPFGQQEAPARRASSSDTARGSQSHRKGPVLDWLKKENLVAEWVAIMHPRR
eukprot:GEMP01087401.1.p1 GENE.GEMP01087401.1~~GEMP01087401.1.p1  ORF type:complete len:176 (+),score=18.42 GEMP01087401.1:96-623(+)